MCKSDSDLEFQKYPGQTPYFKVFEYSDCLDSLKIKKSGFFQKLRLHLIPKTCLKSMIIKNVLLPKLCENRNTSLKFCKKKSCVKLLPQSLKGVKNNHICSRCKLCINFIQI